MRISKKLSALGAFFVIAAAVAGCGGSSSLPSNAVATVAGNPISLRAYQHWMYVAAKYEASQEAGEPTIVSDDPPNFNSCIKQVRAFVPSLAKTSDKQLRSTCKSVFAQYNNEVMSFLIEAYWYQADAAKEGIKFTTAQLMKQFNKAKKSEFKTQAEFTAYLKSTGETEQDLLYQIRVNSIYVKLIAKAQAKVTPAKIAAYYAAHKSEFGTAEARNLHLIRMTTAAKAQAAYDALKSGQSWDTVAKEYAADKASQANGGVLTGVTNGEEEIGVNRAIFAGKVGQLLGPVHGEFGYYVIEVTHITPATQETLAKATAQIKTLLTQQNQSAAEAKVTAESKKNWHAKTTCRAAFSVSDCAGYKAPSTTTTATTTPTVAQSTTATNTATATTNTATATTGTITVNTGSTTTGSSTTSTTTTGG